MGFLTMDAYLFFRETGGSPRFHFIETKSYKVAKFKISNQNARTKPSIGKMLNGTKPQGAKPTAGALQQVSKTKLLETKN
jgi:hypothetical protein